MEDIEVAAFENVLQWIGTGNIVPVTKTVEELKGNITLTAGEIELMKKRCDEDDHNHDEDGKFFDECAGFHCLRHKLSQYFEFLIAADFLLISPDPAPPILSDLKQLLANLEKNSEFQQEEFSKEIIEKIFQLPLKHPARRFVAQVCMDSYLYAKFVDKSYTFVYQEEMESVPGFAAAIGDVFAETLANPDIEYNREGIANRISVLSPVYELSYDIWTLGKKDIVIQDD